MSLELSVLALEFGVLTSAGSLSFKFGAKAKLGCDAFSRVGACGRRPSLSADPGTGSGELGL